MPRIAGHGKLFISPSASISKQRTPPRSELEELNDTTDLGVFDLPVFFDGNQENKMNKVQRTEEL